MRTDVEHRLAVVERDMDRKLTLREHLYVDVVEFEVTGADTEIDVKTRFQSRPVAVRLLEARNLDHPDAPGSTAIQWRWNGGQIRIYNFPGLDENTRYLVRLEVVGG